MNRAHWFRAPVVDGCAHVPSGAQLAAHEDHDECLKHGRPGNGGRSRARRLLQVAVG